MLALGEGYMDFCLSVTTIIKKYFLFINITIVVVVDGITFCFSESTVVTAFISAAMNFIAAVGVSAATTAISATGYFAITPLLCYFASTVITAITLIIS